ncbi:MAG TPA: FtsX-like permease family protein [Chryseosolibacter sp.]
MLRIVLLTALRSFRKNLTISVINLVGLSLGLASCLVAGIYIKNDLTADKFHKDADRIFRVSIKIQDFYMSGSSYLFGETLQEEVPEVIETLKTSDRELNIRIGDEYYKHQVVFADSNFLTFFTFPLREGNRQKALTGLRQVVLSDEMSRKYFGAKNPLGQTIQIEIDNVFADFEITGVAEPTPAYSSMYFDFLVPLENNYLADPNSKNDWNRFFLTTFIKVDKDIAPVEKAMPAFVAKHFPNERDANGDFRFEFLFKSYADHHLNGGFSGGGMREGKSKQSLMVLGGIAIVILVLACFNFMNLTNAQSSRRAIEVGIRKVVGAQRQQLIRQFLVEALVLSAIAAFLALGLAELSLVVFRDLLQTSISLFALVNWDVFVGLVAVTLITAVLAGSYPAFILANLNAITTFRKYIKIGGSNWVTRSVLSLQFTLSIVLIVCAIVMWKQQSYMIEKDLGFNEEQVLVVKVNQKDTASTDYLKDEILKFPEVSHVSRSSHAFTRGSSVSHHTTPDKKSMFIYMMSVDADFIDAMQMQIVKGSGFSNAYPERGSEIMVNEKLIKELGLQDSIGIRLGSRVGWVEKPIIVGVVKDFHHHMLKYDIQPLMFLNNYRLEETYLLVRLQREQIVHGIEKIKALVEKTNPNSAFEFSFLDENVAKQYEAEVRWSGIITLATAMAIFLSVLGLLGLAMFTAEQRKKEIGIRKVLGASLGHLVSLLSKGYLILIAIAFVVAIPASYYLMHEYWLSNFAYKTEFGWPIYLLALTILISIVAMAIGSQTVRAALQNPAETLKEE